MKTFLCQFIFYFNNYLSKKERQVYTSSHKTLEVGRSCRYFDLHVFIVDGHFSNGVQGRKSKEETMSHLVIKVLTHNNPKGIDVQCRCLTPGCQLKLDVYLSFPIFSSPSRGPVTVLTGSQFQWVFLPLSSGRLVLVTESVDVFNCTFSELTRLNSLSLWISSLHHTQMCK